MSRGRHSALVLFVAGIFLGGAGMALAGWDAESNKEGKAGGFDYRSGDFYFAGAGAGAAACPEGKRITGGGAGFDGDSANAALRLVGPDSLSPTVTEKNGFGGYGSVDGLGQTLEVFAICTKMDGIKLRSKAQTSGTPLPGDLVTAKSKCPRGTAVLGGGVKSETLPELILTSAPFDSKDGNSAPDDGWIVRVENGSGILDIFAMAVCSRTLKPSYVSEQTASGTGELAEGVSCKQNEAVVGGGAELTGDEGAYLNSTRPADISDADTTPSDGWVSVAYVDSVARTLTTHAVCVS